MKIFTHTSSDSSLPTSPHRRTLALALGAAAIQPAVVWAQQVGRSYRLGILDFDRADVKTVEMQAFIGELARQGFVEVKNLSIERRYAAGDRDRLDPLAAELVVLRPDAIFTVAGRLGAQAALKATTSTPIVFNATNDPVKAGRSPAAT